MMIMEEPDYESDFDDESDTADPEEEDEEEEQQQGEEEEEEANEEEINSNESNDNLNGQNSSEEISDNSIVGKNNTNAKSSNTPVTNTNQFNFSATKKTIQTQTSGDDNNNKTNNNQLVNGKSNGISDNNNGKNESIENTSDESDIESDINEGEDISKRITQEFEQMKLKFHQEDMKQDIEMQYTRTRHIGNSQKYFGSSTDTNNDENVQRTFEVEVCIENQPRRYSDDTEELRQHSTRTENNSIREETSSGELSEDSSDDNEDEDVINEQNEKENNEKDEKEIQEKKHLLNGSIEKSYISEEEEDGDEIIEDEISDSSSIQVNNSRNSSKVEKQNSKETNGENAESEEKINLKAKLVSEPIVNLEKIPSDIDQLDNNNEIQNNDDLENVITDKKNGLFESENGSFSMEISSKRPSSFNSEDYPFQLSFPNNKRNTPDLRTRLNQNKNLSFSNERMREIDRSNQVLLKKILTQKSSYEARSLIGNKQKQKTLYKNNRQTSAAINRKKQQRQIDMDNQVLKRKLEAIAYRNPMH